MILLSVVIYGQNMSYYRYAVESGKVSYEISGSQTGTEILYFVNYGVKEAKYTNMVMEMFGMKQKTEQVVYLDGYDQYTYDPTNNTGTKTENTMLKQMVESSESNDLGEVGKKMFISMGGEMIREEVFLGKKCEVWEVKSMGTTVWLWNYIPLKTVVDMMGMKISYIATEIQTNINIPRDKIDVPEDIDFKEFDMDNLQNLMDGN